MKDEAKYQLRAKRYGLPPRREEKEKKSEDKKDKK